MVIFCKKRSVVVVCQVVAVNIVEARFL